MLTQKRLKEVILYDADTGFLYWRKSECGVKEGDRAGYISSYGYLSIKVDQKEYHAHRLVWLYHKGYLPENSLDHIDRNKINNRIENLREVSNQCNMRNTGNWITNKSGIKGVRWNGRARKWTAVIVVAGKAIHLGYTNCILEAACLRLAAEQAEEWAGCDSSSPAFQYVKEYFEKGR